MALIAHTFLPRSMFDMDSWYRPLALGLGPSTLDMFDPFDDLDRVMSRNLMWLDQPSFLDFSYRQPRVPKKYRVSLDCEGFNPKSIKTEVKDGKLIITGHEGKEAESQDGDFSVRQFRKTYPLPEGVETDKLVSFMTTSGKLIVEIPIKEEQKTQDKSLATGFPQIVEGENGQKNVAIKLNLPKSIDPSKLSVTCKDRDLIVQAENVNEKEDSRSQTFYYQRTTLPENTDFNSLKCMFENNQLSITAPLHAELKQNIKTVPIEFKNNQAAVEGQKRS